MQTYHITDGTRYLTLRRPARLAQPGDVYELAVPVMGTIAQKIYYRGDRFTVLSRTEEKHPDSDIKSSLGNLKVKCKHMESIWTCFEDQIALGNLILVESTQ